MRQSSVRLHILPCICAFFTALRPTTALPKGANLLLASTVPSSYATSVQEQLTTIGRSDILFIDCPVSGGTARAATGELTIMAGGTEAALEHGHELLLELTAPDKLFIVKGGIGAGSNMKMVHQVLAGLHVTGACEALGLAARLGLDPKETYELVTKDGCESWSWMFENRMERALTAEYRPAASALTILLKDLGIITATGRDTQFPTPLTGIAEQLFLSGVALGWGPDDDSSMVRLYYPEALATVQASSSSKLSLADREQLVLDLLSAVHLVSAAEGIAFAHHLGLDVQQYFSLCADAAGASWSFRARGPEIMAILTGTPSLAATPPKVSLDQRIAGLEKVLVEAKNVGCPLYMGSGAMSELALARLRVGGSVDEVKGLVTGFWGTK
ncbi:6-phosphogluconate dehydrogenase C-terminal domain-like protein [Calocera viscosa TUFC12733]|uniref:6-phosphogluconate dehydrogenase C-terminal domain-like protein n=1 Tax=Calocera viscosa (strain TUFC12733) TaxID=1330018 RepID=A0A167I1J5_CALVF|nr:6-phosphogluconate dehydrogenase C-terminal domain-like protein [Calocera viscosa TUFC12733]